METALYEAIRRGDVAAVRALLDAGADVRYVRPRGYTALIDAMFGRDIAGDVQLVPLVRLLLERGADPSAVSDYGESALRAASRVGRYDAVLALLDGGADIDQLEWTALHGAVALGTVESVRAELAADADVSGLDWWDRTPFLMSVQSGDVAKAEALLAAGATLAERGRDGKTPLTFALDAPESARPAMLRWLLARGSDPNSADESDYRPLRKAASDGDAECVRILLDAGADPLYGPAFGTAIESAGSVEVVRLLVAAGADLSRVDDTMRLALTGLRRTETIDCTPEEYAAAKHPRFGRANPERMDVPFWRAMVACGQTAYHARKAFADEGRERKPVWCFDRFGTSLTELPDGRWVEIAGEHEDWYDQDFCIYNDVIVHGGDGTFDLFGYPEDVFPPTDFHSATLAGGAIYVIGSLGYADSRKPGVTPVYRLDVVTWAMEAVETSGDAPGWIGKHAARLVGGEIEVSGGDVFDRVAGEPRYAANPDTFALDLETRTWSRRPAREEGRRDAGPTTPKPRP